ncbi:transcriptional regulator [Sinorhizobium numidicum]|uniref:Transcriptional regulator n=1 Tax=Sinorhizobium numidicum TaxID=680248 RepID=A0ABY8CU17_9HYPH|nr:transcriptional regulator [Sinorhizobium numidicum]WEX74731.1 transcriptional regulator [Sinorhizobium numidicum]WEX80723.1 transcriptional regulator [Sinorhizobium numidicum]
MPPKSLSELKQIIASRKLVLPPQLERVLRGTLAKPDIVAFGTARSVAAACSVSSTTVVRLASLLGFRTFKQFRELFRHHLRETSLCPQHRTSPAPKVRCV